MALAEVEVVSAFAGPGAAVCPARSCLLPHQLLPSSRESPEPGDSHPHAGRSPSSGVCSEAGTFRKVPRGVSFSDVLTGFSPGPYIQASGPLIL